MKKKNSPYIRKVKEVRLPAKKWSWGIFQDNEVYAFNLGLKEGKAQSRKEFLDFLKSIDWRIPMQPERYYPIQQKIFQKMKELEEKGE